MTPACRVAAIRSSRARPLVAAAVAAAALAGCGRSAQSAEPAVSAAASPGVEPGVGADTLEEALELARAMSWDDLPDAGPAVDLNRIGAILDATGAGTLVETMTASVTDADGLEVFAAEVTIRLQADPPGFHALIDSRKPLDPDLRQYQGLPGFEEHKRSEVIRIGDRYWQHDGAGWSGPRPFGSYYGDLGTARALSRVFVPSMAELPVGEEVVEGFTAKRYRVTGDTLRMSTLWQAITMGIEHTIGLNQPAQPAEVDLWRLASGVVVRASFRVTTTDGRTYAARFDVRDLDKPIQLGPPGR